MATCHADNPSIQVPPALIIALAPRYLFATFGPGQVYLDLKHPRKYVDTMMADKNIARVQRNRMHRAEACVANGIEQLPLFAAAVTAANAAELPLEVVNGCAIAYLASRLVYSWIYIWGMDQGVSPGMRSLSWFASSGACLALFVKSGMKMRAKESGGFLSALFD